MVSGLISTNMGLAPMKHESICRRYESKDGIMISSPSFYICKQCCQLCCLCTGGSQKTFRRSCFFLDPFITFLRKRTISTDFLILYCLFYIFYFFFPVWGGTLKLIIVVSVPALSVFTPESLSFSCCKLLYLSYTLFTYFAMETLIKAFPTPDLRCEAANFPCKSVRFTVDFWLL